MIGSIVHLARRLFWQGTKPDKSFRKDSRRSLNQLVASGIFTLQNRDATVANPVATNTDVNGSFNQRAVGGVYVTFYVEGTQTMPVALIKATLPLLGMLDFSDLLLLSSTPTAYFPPSGNLSMSGMSGSTFYAWAEPTLRRVVARGSLEKTASCSYGFFWS